MTGTDIGETQMADRLETYQASGQKEADRFEYRLYHSVTMWYNGSASAGKVSHYRTIYCKLRVSSRLDW
mgnify:CR=1 FL=1